MVQSSPHTTPFVEIDNAMEIFPDELELEEYIKKGLPLEHKASFNVSVQRNYKNTMIEEEDGFKFYKPQELEEINEQIEDFVFFKNESDKGLMKELKFIKETGMTRDVATQLDFNTRAKLELTFPELRDYNILCFKAKSNTTGRRAMVFPQENMYSKFFDCMKKFLNKYDSQHVPMLKSRIKVKFRGKYVLKIDDDTYRNFMEKIKSTISKYKLTFKLKMPMKRRLIEIESNHEKVKDMRDCMKELVGFLFPKPCVLKDESRKFDFFGMKSRAGDDYIDRLNNKFSGKAYGRWDPKSSRFLLRSDPTVRDQYLNMLETWIGAFNRKVKEFSYKLINRKAYFKFKGKAKDIACKYDAQLKYNHESRSLTIYFHEHIKEDDRLTPAAQTKIKTQEMENLRCQYDSIFQQNVLEQEVSMSFTGKNSKESKDSKFL